MTHGTLYSEMLAFGNEFGTSFPQHGTAPPWQRRYPFLDVFVSIVLDKFNHNLARHSSYVFSKKMFCWYGSTIKSKWPRPVVGSSLCRKFIHSNFLGYVHKVDVCDTIRMHRSVADHVW